MSDGDALAVSFADRARGAGVLDVVREQIRTLLAAHNRGFDLVETEAQMRLVAWSFRGGPDYRQQWRP